MNSRQIKVLQLLVKNESYVTTKTLADCVSISERTLQKDLTVIEDYLSSRHFGLSLDRKKGIGILLKGSAFEKEQALTHLPYLHQSFAHQKELQDLIVFHILQKPHDKVSLDELAAQLFVHRRIVQEEIKKLKPYFLAHQLELQSKPGMGTQIIGSEEHKRKLLIKTLKKMKQSDLKNPTLKEFFKQDRLKVIRNSLLDVLEKHDITEFPDLSNIEIHIYFMLERMTDGKEIDLSESEIEAVTNSKAQLISSQVLANLANIYPISFSPSEINYLALRIASTIPSIKTRIQFNKEALYLRDYLIQQVSDIFHYSLEEDVILKENLQSHLSSAFFRLNFNLTISNPLTEDIFNAYPQLFLVLQLLLDDFYKKRQAFIPQEEIAYLTIHFQSAMERQKRRKSRQFRVLLVSEYSKAMASFIEARLQRELPELDVLDLIEHKDLNDNWDFEGVDFVLSTLNGLHLDLPVLTISPMITEEDVTRIEKYMLENQPKEFTKHFDLASFTHPFLVYPQLDLTQPEEVLTFMGNHLVSNGYVDSQFVTELLARDQFSSTKVAPFITLPHANPEFVKQSMISIATFKRPIDWHNEAIRIVIMISVSKDDLKNAEFKKLFSVIRYVSQSQERMEQICQSHHALEILHLLSTYE